MPPTPGSRKNSLPPRSFVFYTDILKAGGGDEDEPMTLRGVASSTVEDLHGDTIERSALKDMEEAVNAGLNIFLNHMYRVPEDVAGFSETAKVARRGKSAEGTPIYDLDIDIAINDTNPRAVEAWKGINGGKWKAGLSIGANIPEDGYTYDEKTGKFSIQHIKLLETSIVGIPANQRSWISKAVEALRDDIDGGDDEDVVSLSVVKSEEIEQAPPADDRSDELDEEVVEPEETNDTSPEEPGDQSVTNDSEPEADPATPASEESTSADPSEVEALEGDPDPAQMLASLSEVEGEVTLTHLHSAVQVGIALAERITGLEQERDDALKAKSEAERERQEMAARVQEVLSQTKEVIQAVGDLPIGRKADKAKVQRDAARKLSHLETTYGPEFMKMLEK